MDILNVETIKMLISEITSSQNTKRKVEEYENYRMYEGKLIPYVESSLKKMFPETYSFYTIADYNIHKKIINKIGKSYKTPPIRILDKKDESETYSKIAKRGKLNKAMAKLDKMFVGHKYAAMFITRNKGLSVEKDEFKFIPLAPYEFDVIFDSFGNALCWILSYPDLRGAIGTEDYIETIIATTGTQKAKEGNVFAFWTNEKHVIVKTELDKDNKISAIKLVELEKNKDNVNPYGIMPFVFVPEAVNGNYPEQSTNPFKCTTLNTSISIYLTSANMQIGQMVLEFPETAKVQYVPHGLMSAIKLPQSKNPNDPRTSANYISPSANLEGQKEAILTYMQMILDENGIETNSVIAPNEQFASGFDRLLSSASVQAQIEENQLIYIDIENDIYKIVKKILSNDSTYTFTDDEISVLYPKPKVMITDGEKLDNIKKKIDMDLIEDWEKFIEVDPNLTEQQAKDKLKRIIEQKKQKVQIFSTGSIDDAQDDDLNDIEGDEDAVQ